MPPKAKPKKTAQALNSVARKYQITVELSDMAKDVESKVIAYTEEAFSQCAIEKDVARYIKVKTDALFPQTTWHCIVGSHFAVSISHASENIIFLRVNQHSVLLFKSLD
jgi:hypothetical protein